MKKNNQKSGVDGMLQKIRECANEMEGSIEVRYGALEWEITLVTFKEWCVEGKDTLDHTVIGENKKIETALDEALEYLENKK